MKYALYWFRSPTGEIRVHSDKACPEEALLPVSPG